MPGHNGGAKGPFFLDSGALADDVERRMDALGWDTAHIVGNSLGGWVAFELERRGRARTLTGIAPAGGWRHFTPAKFEIVGKFLAGMPIWLFTLAFRRRVLKLPITRYRRTCPSAPRRTACPTRTCADIIDDVSHCPAYYQLLVKSLTTAGPAGDGRGHVADAPGHLREGPGAAASAVHPPLHHPPAEGHAGHSPRRRRAHPDVRGAAAGSPT